MRHRSGVEPGTNRRGIARKMENRTENRKKNVKRGGGEIKIFNFRFTCAVGGVGARFEQSVFFIFRSGGGVGGGDGMCDGYEKGRGVLVYGWGLEDGGGIRMRGGAFDTGTEGAQ